MFPSDTDFKTKVTFETGASPLEDELPFHILFLGDWSGRESRSLTTAPDLRPIEIDRDNFGDVIKRLDTGLELKFQDGGETTLSLSFSDLDDFHPDQIFQNLPLFADLRNIRQRLTKADTFDDAAREVRSWLANSENSEVAQIEKEAVSPEAKPPLPNDLLDQILGKNDTETFANRSKNSETSELSGLIAKLVRPHIIQTDTAEQSRLLMIVDEVTSDLMRKILHHPQFQALESAWRGIYMLVRRIETDASLKFFLLDISKAELAGNLKSADNLIDSGIYQTLFGNTAEPWAIFCGNYTFGLNIDDISVLIRLSKIGSNANTPFVSHTEPAMFGFNSFVSEAAFDVWRIFENSSEVKLWETLRSVSESNYLGLAVPRFLARVPYGEQSEPTESFYFEEFTPSQKHEQFLWANPSFLCAFLFAQSFQQSGWGLMSDIKQDIQGLPMYLYKDGYESKMKPCVEVSISEINCEKLLKQGLMPLISFRDTDKVRLAQLQSIAFSSSRLKGRWI